MKQSSNLFNGTVHMKKTKLHLNYAGFCWAKENHSLRKGENRNIKFHALWGLIEHPENGLILYDTAYTERFYEATKRFPNIIYAKITKVEINQEDEIKSQLLRNGVDPNDIKHILLTHFHADHIGGLLDFPNATIHTSRKAYNHAKKLSNKLAFSKGVLKDLLPTDMEERIAFIEETGASKEDPIFGTTYDLFHDDSLVIVPLPGHAAGQIGVKLQTEKQAYFLVADACWHEATYKNLRLPHPIVRLFFHSWSDFKATVLKLNAFHRSQPDVLLVPTHCSQTTDRLVTDKIDLHVL
jgi:glyoxylase-like metal-dependent hydrolase (beta-lactamase superfamily II)